jgi:uncharacterized protein (TIGR00290 family)
MLPKLLLSWSGGKDSAWCLHVLRGRSEYEVAGLLTTFNRESRRVAMHEVRSDLLAAQARAADLPLREVEVPWPCSNQQYEQIMQEALSDARAAGILHVAFGDLFLQDIRAFREQQMARLGLTPVFPLWGEDTRALAERMTTAGLAAVIACVDTRLAPPALAGRTFDASLLPELPPEVDPCGENGEFHTFCFAGPMFSAPLPVRVGASTVRGPFLYTEVEPLEGSACA